MYHIISLVKPIRQLHSHKTKNQEVHKPLHIYRKPCRKSALDTGLGIQKFCVCICMMYMIVCMFMHVCTCVVSWYFCCVYKMPYHCCLLVHITTSCHEYQPPCFVNQSINQSTTTTTRRMEQKSRRRCR